MISGRSAIWYGNYRWRYFPLLPIEQAAIVITAPNKCEGYAEGGNFCGLRTPYKVYFVAEFDTDAFGIGKHGKEMN